MPVTINGNNTPTAGGVTYGDGTTYANTAAGSAGGVLYSAGSSAPAFTAAGNSGQVLQSNGASAPTWTTISAGNFGTDLSYADYSLTLSSGITTFVEETILMQAVSLNGTSELMVLHGSASAHAVVFNTSTNTFGTPVLLRTTNLDAISNIALAKISSTEVLVCSLPFSSTALQTVVLTVSGSTITVGTVLSTTLAAASSLVTPNTRLVTVGSSYVLNYYNTTGTAPKFRAITVSGSTPTVGSELAYAGGTVAAMQHSYAHSASILLSFSMTASTTVFVLPITVSGTTLTAGTAATVSTTSTTNIVTGALSNSRYALAYLNTTGRGAVVSVAGSVASISTATATMDVGTWVPQMQVFGNQAFIRGGQSTNEYTNVITDTSGTATLGTGILQNVGCFFVGYLSTGKVFLSNATSGDSDYYQYGISSGSPVYEKAFPNVTNTQTSRTLQNAPYSRPLSGSPQSGSGITTVLRTSAGKTACARTSSLPFTASIDGISTSKPQQSANPFSAYNDGISESVAWGIPPSIAASTTAVQLRKVTLV